MNFFWDLHLLNLSKALGELGQRIEMHLHLLVKFIKCLADLGEARGCSINSLVIDQFIQ